MEVKRFLTIFREDCAVLVVIFDPAVDIGLHLIPVISRLLPIELRPVFNCCHFFAIV
jgi:hypothetical protein